MSGFSPRHISIFIPTLTGGGVEKNMVHLSRGFVDRGYTVDMVLAKAVGPFLDELDPRVHLVDLKSSRVLAAIPGLVRYLRRRRPDILLAGMGHANIVALIARWVSRISCRVVVSVHTVLSVHKKYSDKKLTGAIPLLARFFYPAAAGIIAVSDDVAADLVKISGLAPDSITVIGNPVVTPELRAGYDQRPPHRFFGPGMPPVVLSVGRMDAQKAFDVLLEAHALLLKQTPHHLLILGDGRDRLRLETQAADLGVTDTVDMPGFVEQVPGYMAQSAVFALASRFEGFGNVLVEALAGGLPVVATQCSGGPSFILEGGRFGRLVPVEDPQALADALAQVLADPPDTEELVRRAEDFSLDSITEAYLALFQDISPEN